MRTTRAPAERARDALIAFLQQAHPHALTRLRADLGQASPWLMQQRVAEEKRR